MDPDQGAIYEGHVMHMRLRPRAHRFRYRVFTLLLDVDRLPDTAARLRLFACNRRALFSHHDRDHGPRDGSPLRPWAEALLAANNRPHPARIRLLAMPRVLNRVFNPLSVYFCEDAEGRLHTAIYEVKNTFGDQIPYVLAADGDGPRRHAHTKEMFVSPFIGMDQTYRFHLAPPSDRLAIRIKQGDADGDLLIAAQNGRRLPLTDAALARTRADRPAAALQGHGRDPLAGPAPLAQGRPFPPLSRPLPPSRAGAGPLTSPEPQRSRRP